MKKNTSAKRGPGRPMYQPKFPRSLKWTLTDFCERNGVDLETGKGTECTRLTLNKFLKRPVGKSTVARIKGETANPNGKSGLGRKPFLYVLRSRQGELKANQTAPKATRAPRKAKSVTVDVGLSQTSSDYEATKAALLAPSPVAATLEATPENSPALAPDEVTA